MILQTVSSYLWILTYTFLYRYYHELFLRGRIDLTKRMVRTRVKGNGSKAASSPATEPNFYTMTPCTEDPVRRHVSIGSFSESAAAAAHMTRVDASSNDLMMIVTSHSMLDEDSTTETEKGPSFPLITNDWEKTPSPPDDADETCDHRSPQLPMSPVAKKNRPVKFLGGTPCPPMSRRRRIKKSSLNIPIVSPCEPKEMVSVPFTPQILESLSIPSHKGNRERSSSVDLPEDIHSGDTIFFEGLPFHYLETKDVEDGLLHH